MKIFLKKESRLILAKEFNVSEDYVYRALCFKKNGFIPRQIRVRAANEFRSFII